MLPSYLEGPNGCFPYNSLGGDHALYTMGISKSNPSQELYQEQVTKGYLVPFEYDHQEHRVKKSLVRYLNAPDLCFEPDPDKAVIAFVSKDQSSSTKIYIISNDLCLYVLENPVIFSGGSISDFLGMHIKKIRQSKSFHLLKDEKYSKLMMILNSNCCDYAEPWFCDSIEKWREVWVNNWDQNGYAEDWRN